jgi:hypothetical protein
MLTRNSRKPGGKGKRKSSDLLIRDLLRRHFGRGKLAKLWICERQFPVRVRADLHRALDQLLTAKTGVVHFSGVMRPYNSGESLDFAALTVDAAHNPPVAAPPQYEDLDIGEESPIRCLKTGLWLLDRGGQKYAVLVAPSERYGRRATGIRFQIATIYDARSNKLVDGFFRTLEKAVQDCRSYRGKILSLEYEDHYYSGQSTGIKVHKLRTVSREQVILPGRTVDLLERNVIQFVRRRGGLARFGQSTKKGILFYGPPGTGKSHTIHYLAGALEGHTTLLITAEQAGYLGEYMTLARLLQPSVVVIEDVDLIARDRSQMHGPCQESLLNKLLNEMDGLKEAADVLFILTTNRPQELEAALSSRPGRIDQAIEFPLPDETGRAKLVRLYAGSAELSDELVDAIVARTANVSAAFIKELMRRAIQFRLERNGDSGLAVDLSDVDGALEEMLFSGGSLNAKLLGGAEGRVVGFGRV